MFSPEPARQNIDGTIGSWRPPVQFNGPECRFPPTAPCFSFCSTFFSAALCCCFGVVVVVAHPLMMMMMPTSSMRRTTLLILLLAAATIAEDANSQYRIRQGPCFRVRIDQGNDDDGNAYFYNGAYRSQYQRYIAFSLCDQNDDTSCTEYVTDLESYLGESVGYIQNYCDTCAAQCSRRRFRRLEDEQEEGDDAAEEEAAWDVDCSVCSSECEPLLKDDGSGLDESQYLDCEQAEADGDDDGDVDYYTAPQCENGEVVIGHFYDNECTIKTSTLQDGGFSYSTFKTMESTPIRCEYDNDACMNLFGDDAVYCGEDADDGDNEHLCKAAKAAGRVYTFYKKPIYKKLHLGALTILLLFVTSIFGFLAYTYFVRHNRTLSPTKTPMADLDGEGAADLPALS